MNLQSDSFEGRAGQVCGSYDTDIHEVSNRQPDGRPLITLHIYTPPLHAMGKYTRDSTKVERFHDPIFEFAQGAGI